jgi:hypothetical protein
MAVNSKSKGILPTDLIIKSVVERGLADLRRYPYLLDDIFSPLSDDDETNRVYGKKLSDQGREWFLNNQVYVRIADSIDPPKMPCVVISLAESREDKTTLADVHYEPSVPDDRAWPSLAGPVDPVSYDPATGLLVLPPSVTLVVVPGMIVVDRTGIQHTVLSSPQPTVVELPKGLSNDLTGLTVRGARPVRTHFLESVVETQTYRLGVHVAGKAAYMSFLFPIMQYVMYREQNALEGRGFEQVDLSFSGPERFTEAGETNEVYSRYITLTGAVRQTWTKSNDGFDRMYSMTLAGNVMPTSGDDSVDLDGDVLGG